MYYSLHNIWLIIFFLLLSISTKASIIFLFISLVFIILYYIQRNRMTIYTTEKYTNGFIPDSIGHTTFGTAEPTFDPAEPTKSGTWAGRSPRSPDTRFGRAPSNSKITYSGAVDIGSGPVVAATGIIPFCNDEIPIQSDNVNYMYQNQRLAGKPNPKTLIPPVITPPPMELEHWRANNLVNHSRINTGSQVDTYLSGYSISPERPLPLVDTLFFEYPYNRDLRSDLLNTNSDVSDNINLYTQTIQPDVFTRNEVIEPINSNIGISYTPQFQPLTFTNVSRAETNCGGLITESEVYDPRFSGYGSSNRSYIEPVTGQPRFYYDDVDSVRMPNYICRSNIDFAKYADSYGPLTEYNMDGIQNGNELRALAQDSFLRSSLQQRTELQERLMRKRNNEMWQLRKYPKRTF